MNRITEENFKGLYPKVKEALSGASFIAIDAEFSGLRFTHEAEDPSGESLFDSPKERYAKLRRNIEPFIAIQIGLTAFTHLKHKNEYRAESFDFHLMPRALPMKNRTFLIQATAIEFLSSYKFDFNQLAYDAISYLDEEDSDKLSKSLQDGASPWDSKDSHSADGRTEMDECLSTIEKWLQNAGKHADAVLKMDTSGFSNSYRMQKEARRSFKNIWTESSGTKAFSVIRVNADVRQSLEEKNRVEDRLNDELLDYYTGFSKVFRLMTSLRKPIVGHNLLLDLMFMHKQFFRPLPRNYETFKSNINRLFPFVYDTKFLSYEMKSVLKKASWKSNVLADLYHYYGDGPGRYLALNSPRITLPVASNDTQDCEIRFHDAAWDSYCTGYCFVRMAHICAVKKYDGISSDADLREFTNTEIMSAVGRWVNRINLIRADLSYLRLDGPDPESTRPRWLFVKTSADHFTTYQIAQALSRFGIVDVKRFSENEALVAVPHHGAAREILKHYERSKEFRIVPYNPLRHSSRTIKAIMWAGGLFLSGAGILTCILCRGGCTPRD